MEHFVTSLTPEQKAEFAKLLTQSETVVEDDERVIPMTVDEGHAIDIDENFKVKRADGSQRGGRTRVQGRENTWEDKGEIFEDTEMPEASKKIPKTTRNRPEPQMKEIQCSACGKTHTVNSAVVYGKFHRCDSCGNE